MAKPPDQYVTKVQLRGLFDDVLSRIEAGEILEAVVSDGPANPAYRQPPGTRSQIVAYWEVKEGKIGAKLAIAHRYQRPDGTLGGSGRHLPDPKRVLCGGYEFECYPWDPHVWEPPVSTEKGYT